MTLNEMHGPGDPPHLSPFHDPVMSHIFMILGDPLISHPYITPSPSPISHSFLTLQAHYGQLTVHVSKDAG